MYLGIADYAVTVVVLAIPLAIGVFYAWKDAKNASREEYMVGGREMTMLPVSFSIFVTYQSAISLIGIPSDVFSNGPMVFAIHIGMAVSNIVGCYTMIPLMYPLRLTSIYDYMELRFESRAVRILSTVIGMLQTFFYMVVALLAPGLAVQAAAGLPFWMSVAVVGSIGTLYTAIGGIKSVIWTDAFQTAIVFLGIIILISRGVFVIGGVDKVWSIAEAGGRTDFSTIDIDLRTRHTWWGAIFFAFTWLSSVFNQSSLQRMASMKNMKSAKKAYLLNAPSNILYGFLLTMVGIVVYSYFSVIRCDPIKSKLVSNPNQLVLIYVLHALQDFPGLAGFFMATIFSGALSTLSSGINALATNTIEDILGARLSGFSERTITLLAKALVFIYGIIIMGLSYLAKSLEGPVTQVSISVFGVCGSAVLGMFVVACTVPWANKYGALAGGFVTMAINTWIIIGSRMYGKKTTPLPSLPTDQCGSFINGSSWTMPNTTSWTTTDVTPSNSTLFTSTVSNETSDNGFYLYDLSYLWYGMAGTIVCTVTILLVSCLTGGRRNSKPDARFILPMLRKFWGLEESPVNSVKDEELEKFCEK